MASSTKLAASFPPDFCSAETLAHRLDCSVSTVHAYVRRGLLPKPARLGDLVRWRWADVERFIDELEKLPAQADAADPYLAGLENMARPRKPTIELPPHVNVVRVKGRPYYYCHLGRGTKDARKPIRLPDDPRATGILDCLPPGNGSARAAALSQRRRGPRRGI